MNHLSYTHFLSNFNVFHYFGIVKNDTKKGANLIMKISKFNDMMTSKGQYLSLYLKSGINNNVFGNHPLPFLLKETTRLLKKT